MDIEQQKLLMDELKKYFKPQQIQELVMNNTLSQLRKFTSEISITYFAKAYFPLYFDRDFGNFHNELFAEIKNLTNSKGCISAFGLPREHGKSTILSFLFPLYLTLTGKSRFTLIVSATEAIAQPFLDMIKNEITKNEAIIEDYGNIKGSRWNANEIWVSNSNGIDSAIMIRGIEGSLRGVHYTHLRPEYVFLDDLLKEEQISSETKRQDIKDRFKNIIMSIGTKDTNILVVGTVLHEDDLVSDLLNNKIAGVKSIRKSAVEEFSTRDDLWLEWQRLYTNLDDINRIDTAHDYYLANKQAMIINTKVLWHEHFSYYDMMVKKLRMGESAFYRELMNNPRNNQDYPFINLQYWDKLPKWDDLDVVCMIDPSLGKSSKSDFTAVVTLAKHRQTGQIYVVDGHIQRVLAHDIIDLVVDKLNTFPITTVGVETVQFQSLLFDDIKRRLIDEKLYVKMNPIHTRSNKEVRIAGLENAISNGYIKFNRESTTFNQQMMDYNGKKSKYDDAPDALALGVSMLGKNTPKKITFMERHKWGL